MLLRQVLLSLFIIVVAQNTSIAQSLSGNFFGDKDQPGNRLHTNIAQISDTGIEMPKAIKTAIDNSLTDTDNTLNAKAKSAVAFDIDLANQFYEEMVEVNSLIDVTKVIIENNSDKTVHIITLGVILYPDFVQEVFDGAALTGEMTPEDILVAAIQAGADPSLISDATAAGDTQETAISILPLGAGIGAGGTGGGDTTASSN